MNKYVVGFLFDENMENVVLIHKNRPDWQKGLLNGVGGKIEDNETPLLAMQREFSEETGLQIDNWQGYAEIEDTDWIVYFFYTISDKWNQAETMTDEKIKFIPTNDLFSYPMVPNLYWLLPMCLDKYHSYCKATTTKVAKTDRI
jgi:8-oxo-dGTP diphosphatase